MEALKAGVVVTGTEVVAGVVDEVNSAWLSKQLLGLGMNLGPVSFANDRADEVKNAIEFELKCGADVLVISGGLGPTADDLTLKAISEFFGLKLITDERLAGLIRSRLAPLIDKLNLDLGAVELSTEKQSLVPQGAYVVDPAGTAPGLVMALDGVLLIVLPGPPRELKAMWPGVVATEAFQEALGAAPGVTERTVRLFGIPESEIEKSQREIADHVDLSKLEIATCMRRAEIEVSVRFVKDHVELADSFFALLEERHSEHIFSNDGSSVEDQLKGLLNGRTLAAAESCTAGLLAAKITSVPGSSQYFLGGVVSYADLAKRELLGVTAELLERDGAVSSTVAEAMASGIRERLGSDYGVSITGIAGPDGGSEEKPVGRVYVSIAGPEGGFHTRELDLFGGRDEIRERSVTIALHMLRRRLVSGASSEVA